MDPTGVTTGGLMLYNNPSANGNSSGISLTGARFAWLRPRAARTRGSPSSRSARPLWRLSITGQGGTQISGTFYAAGAPIAGNGQRLDERRRDRVAIHKSHAADRRVTASSVSTGTPKQTAPSASSRSLSKALARRPARTSLFRADGGEPVGAAANDGWDVGQSLDVIDQGRRAPEARPHRPSSRRRRGTSRAPAQIPSRRETSLASGPRSGRQYKDAWPVPRVRHPAHSIQQIRKFFLHQRPRPPVRQGTPRRIPRSAAE